MLVQRKVAFPCASSVLCVWGPHLSCSHVYIVCGSVGVLCGGVWVLSPAINCTLCGVGVGLHLSPAIKCTLCGVGVWLHILSWAHVAFSYHRSFSRQILNGEERAVLAVELALATSIAYHHVPRNSCQGSFLLKSPLPQRRATPLPHPLPM